MMYKETTKASYEATAEQYARNVENLAPIDSIKKFKSLLPQKPKILDLGCGSGRDAKIFTELGAEVIGIDFCSNLINIAKKQAPLATFYLMDIENMTFENESFDGIWAASSLLHIPKQNIENVFKKIHALLKHKSFFYLCVKEGYGESLERDVRYEGNFLKFWTFFEEQELKTTLEKAHFKILDLSYVPKKHNYQSHPCYRVFCQK